MAQRIEVVISAQDDYSAALQKFNEAMGKAGVAVNQTAAATNEWTEFLKGRMGPAMKEFGNHTDAIRALSAEYKTYKATGVAAHQAVDAAAGNSVSAISMLKSAWVGIAAAYIATNWLQSAVKAALDAEERYSKLSVQVEGLGIAFRSVEPQMQAAIAASSRYASVTGDEATKALQELIFHSGDYDESLRRLNLTLDLAYQKGISTSEAAVVMGRAIAGNTAGLARFLPELSNLDEKLGKFATEAERGAYSMRVMEERALGAAGAMTEHNKKLKEVMIAYDAVHQFVGGVIVDDLYRIVEGVRAVSDVWDELGFVFDSIAAKINPNIVAVRKNTDGLMDYEKAIRLVGSAHDKTAAQMEAAILKESKAREQSAKEAEVDEQIRRAALMATNIEGGSSLPALVLGSLSMPPEEEFTLTAELVNKKFIDKMIIAANQFGGKDYAAELAAGFAAAGEEQETDPFAAATGDLNFQMALVTKVSDDLIKAANDPAIIKAKQELFNLSNNTPYSGAAGFEEASRMNEIAAIQYHYETRLAMLNDFNTKAIIAKSQAIQDDDVVEQYHLDLTLAKAQKEKELKLAVYASMAGQLSALSGQMHTALEGKQKAFFYMQRALAVASILINTHMAATAAMAPPPVGAGPILGIPVSTWITAMGYTRAALTLATTFNGSSGVGSGSSSPSGIGGGGGVGALPIAAPDVSQAEARPNLTIVIEHAELMGDEAMTSFAYRLSTLVEKYDVKLVASRTV